MAPGEPLLDLREVTRLYDRGRVAALRGLTLRVERGEWVTLSGPSGSGKSTLLHILSGLDRPTSGRVRFAGREPRSRREWTALRRRRIGFVFQSFHLIPTLTAEQNVMVPIFGTGASSHARRERARSLLARVGLAGRARHLPAELSGGERQRVAIARALANAPELLLADEPTGNLDSAATREIVALLGELRRDRAEMTIVLASHEPDLAAASERIVHLVDGRAT